MTAAAALVTAVGLLARRSAVLPAVLLVAAALTLPVVVAAPPDGDLAFSLFLVATGSGLALPGVLTVLAGSAWPPGPAGHRPRLLLGSVLVCTVVPGAAAVLAFDPAGSGCFDCPRNVFEAVDAPGVAVALQRVSAVLTLGCVPLPAALAVDAWRRATGLGRRHGALVVAGTTGAALVTAAAAACSLALPAGALDDVQRGLWLVQCVMLAVVAAGIVLQLVLVRTATARMATRVVAAIPDPDAVQTWLRDGAGDPGLTVTFVRDDGAAVDARGAVVPPATDGAVVLLSRDGVVFADVRTTSRAGQGIDLVRACARSAGLALEYVAAGARLRAELLESAAVRARIVAAGDRERRRLERNLHDGAQQRLVALGVMLAAVSRAGGDVAAHHREIDTALAELRTHARGLFPASLGEAGVGAALRELGDHTDVPLIVRDDLTPDVPLPVGTAIYRLVLDAARLAPPESVLQVSLGRTGADAHVTVTVEHPDDGAPAPVDPPVGRLLQSEDRFVALGGRLDHAVRPGVLHWEGVAPCA